MIFDVLRRFAEAGKGKHLAFGPERGPPGNHGVRMHHDAVAELDTGTDHAKRTNVDLRRQVSRSDRPGRSHECWPYSSCLCLYDHGADLGFGDELTFNVSLRAKPPHTAAVAHF